MKPITRRSFLRSGASVAIAVAAVPMIPSGCLRSPSESKTGYFESEFGISDGLCRKVLAKALSRGGDFADLFLLTEDWMAETSWHE